jgi:hypothetical protein
MLLIIFALLLVSVIIWAFITLARAERELANKLKQELMLRRALRGHPEMRKLLRGEVDALLVTVDGTQYRVTTWK